MTMTTSRPVPAEKTRGPVRQPRPLIAIWLSGAVGLAAVAAGFLVGRDGSPLWQAVRIVVVIALASAAIYAIERGPTLLAGATSFLIGVTCTALGGGIGPAHLSKVGWSPVTVAGLVTLVAGVFILVVGAEVTVRCAGRWWWQLLVGSAILLATYAALWSGVQAVAVTNVAWSQVHTSSPADRGVAYRDVQFMTSDGVRLSGWYVPSTNGAAVVLLHGAGSTRSDVLDHAVVLARHGYGVLLFDARGHGRSDGRAMDFGWHGDNDVSAAVSFLVASGDVDRQRIAAVGMSMGGEEAVGAAASDSRIRAVVAEGATNRVAGDKAFLPEAYGVRGHIQQGIDWLTYAITDLLTEASPPIALRAAAAAAAPRPVLLIVGGTVPEEAHAARHIQRGNAFVQVWEVPGAGHTRALYTRQGEWEQRVTAFLDSALAAPVR